MSKKLMIAIAWVALGGCATVPLPSERLTRSEATIRAAEELGAANVPAAQLHLKLAKEQAEAARRLAAEGSPRAPLLLARAQSDAELALALVREAGIHRDAVQAEEGLEAIQERGAP